MTAVERLPSEPTGQGVRTELASLDDDGATDGEAVLRLVRTELASLDDLQPQGLSGLMLLWTAKRIMGLSARVIEFSERRRARKARKSSPS